jgi:hypothetical protein
MNERLQTFIAYVVARLSEASTWRGIILVVTALCGWNVPEEKIAAVVLVGVTLAGLAGMLLPDKPKGTP